MAAVDTTAVSEQGITLHNDPVPLQIDAEGTIRVRGKRITLDLIVEEFKHGLPPERMVDEYDTLQLAEVYAVIAYYLRHAEEVDAYIERRNIAARKLQAQIETQRPPLSRSELLARLEAREHVNAASGD
jgi:uncharacterized protein (DUF433 family)